MSPGVLWWTYVELSPNGRHEVHCKTCHNKFWLTRREICKWTVCPHCKGWWVWPGTTKGQAEA